jgi:hypothetical protein
MPARAMSDALAHPRSGARRAANRRTAGDAATASERDAEDG